MKIDEIIMPSFGKKAAPRIRYKAGVIPYYFQNGQPVMMFVIPSDPAYGGSAPQISKGQNDPGDKTPLETAIREAGEEMGLPPNAIAKTHLGYTGELTGYTESYKFYVFGALLGRMPQFKNRDGEISKFMWLTPEQFEQTGRSTQRDIVRQFVTTLQP